MVSSIYSICLNRLSVRMASPLFHAPLSLMYYTHMYVFVLLVLVLVPYFPVSIFVYLSLPATNLSQHSRPMPHALSSK